MTKSIQCYRTTEELLELAKRYVPECSEELSVLLREVLGDLESLQEELHQPPQEEDAAQLIADIQVHSETLARKCRQLAKALDKLLEKMPDEVVLPIS
jgi:hypothetical protein